MKSFTNFLFIALFSCITFLASAQNNCLHYDGINDQVSFTSPLTSAGLMNNFSVACHFKAENTNTSSGIILRLFGWGTDRFEFGDMAGTLVFYTNQTGIVATTATGIRDGQCHHVVVTKSSNPNQVQVYYDNNLVLTQPLFTPLTLSSLARIGNWAGGNTNQSRWKGLIDQFEVYEGALNQAQVTSLFNYTPIAQPLLTQFTFNQGISGGNNAGLTNVVNTIVPAGPGTAQNFALNGATSNWVLWPCGPQPLAINCNITTDLYQVCNDPGLCGAYIPLPLPTITGGIAPLTISTTAPIGNFFPVGYTQVCNTVTDGAGNSATCCYWIQVIDCENPVVFCVSTVLCNDPGLCSATLPDITGMIAALDNCGIASVTQSPAAGTPLPVGLNLIAMTAIDFSGNAATCNNYVQVNDCEAPTLICPADFTVCNDPGLCSAFVYAPDPTVYDNCQSPVVGGGVTVVANQPTGPVNLAAIQSHLFSFVATDAAGNTATCQYSITVLDCEAPIINCPPAGAIVTVCNTPGMCGILASSITPSVTDNCGGQVSIQFASPLAYIPVGTSWVCFVATDLSGNVSDCCFAVRVNNCEAPIINCPSNVTACVCNGNYTPVAPTTSDNCAPVTVSPPMISGTYAAGTVTTITYLVTDASGNTATCSYTVTVPACTAPVITNVAAITTTSVKIFYTKPPCVTQMQYSIRYKIGNTWSAWLSVSYPSRGSSKVITGLTCGRTYQVRIRAKCCNVYSPWSATKTFNTLPCPFNMSAPNTDEAVASDEINTQARLYPNPATDRLNIELPQLDAQTIVTLTDLTGRTITSIQPDESGLTQFEVGNLPSGVYMVVVRSSRSVQTLRFIKE